MPEKFVTVQNPIIYSDFPDPCVINADGVYYMTCTSMHFMPGVPILRSFDLAHWEIVSHVYDTMLDNDEHNLQNGSDIYGRGSWATCLRYHKGLFYVCFNSNDAQNTFVYRTPDIENGPWERSVLQGSHHDPSLLFDDDGRTYIVYGCGTIYIKELEADGMAVKPNGVNQILVNTPKVTGLNCEGSHFMKINGRYCLMLIQWPVTGKNRRIQWCYRCDTLLGEYIGKVVLDDDLGYRNCGVAQGGLFEAGDGRWFAMLFQDRGALGRCPILLTVEWLDGWPVLGKNGKAQHMFTLPYQESAAASVVQSDEFENTNKTLSPVWQWNHNPDHDAWLLTARPGWLRLMNKQPVPGIERARNMLTQRTVGPACAFWTKLDTGGMLPGDCAGLVALQSLFGFIGVRLTSEGKYIVFVTGERENETVLASVPTDAAIVYLRILFTYTNGEDNAEFSYSLDDRNWVVPGEELHMQYRLAHFTGYHAALCSYATEQAGGYADFDYMRVRVL